MNMYKTSNISHRAFRPVGSCLIFSRRAAAQFEVHSFWYLNIRTAAGIDVS